MANIVIDGVELSSWTGENWLFNFCVTDDENHQEWSSVAVAPTTTAVQINAAIIARAIEVIEAAGASTVGLLNVKHLVGAVS